MRGEDERKLKTTVVSILQILCGKILKNKIGNNKICEKVEVESIDEFL